MSFPTCALQACFYDGDPVSYALAMETRTRKPTYIRPPAQNIPVGPDDVPLLVVQDAQAESERTADVIRRLLGIVAKCETTKSLALDGITLIKRGVTLPDLAEAIGLPAPVQRVTKSLKPWRIRKGSNMDVIATMLEEAGIRGVSESEMIARLRELGRLQSADMPLRAVHWTISELQRRTKFLERRSRANGARWYSYGRFDIWRVLRDRA